MPNGVYKKIFLKNGEQLRRTGSAVVNVATSQMAARLERARETGSQKVPFWHYITYSLGSTENFVCELYCTHSGAIRVPTAGGQESMPPGDSQTQQPNATGRGMHRPLSKHA